MRRKEEEGGKGLVAPPSQRFNRDELGSGHPEQMLERSAAVPAANRDVLRRVASESSVGEFAEPWVAESGVCSGVLLAAGTAALRSQPSTQLPAGTAGERVAAGTTALRFNDSLTRQANALFRRLLRRPPMPRQLDVLDGYARWAATYEQDMDGHPLALAESGAMLALLPDCVGLTALDAACGTGRYARLLAEHGARRIIGVDQSAEMLERARAIPAPLPAGTPALRPTPLPAGTPALRPASLPTETLPTSAIEFIQGTLLALPLPDESCDLAVVALALAHLATVHLEAAFAELRRVLRRGGILLMSELHPFGALTGGRCRFETDSGTGRQVYHILTHTHLHEDYLAAASAADLTLEALREPRLTPDLVPAFERAGMGAFARQFAGFPLALVCRWRADSFA